MANEVNEFAKAIGAISLREKLTLTRHAHLFRRDNYFSLNDVFLIVKISRSSRPFWGFGKDFFDLFNMLTENTKPYFFVALISKESGWLLPKQEIINQIFDDDLSYSENQGQYKINPYNLRDRYSFLSAKSFVIKIGS